jgi:hypothetical protein
MSQYCLGEVAEKDGMMAGQQAVVVEVFGQHFTLHSDKSEDEVRLIAAYVNQHLQKAMAGQRCRVAVRAEGRRGPRGHRPSECPVKLDKMRLRHGAGEGHQGQRLSLIGRG